MAENGAAGLEAFRQLKDSICLALLDLVLPGMFNGVELARKIREIDPSVKILLMTGYTDEIVAQAGGSLLPIIRKPFLSVDLVRRIQFIHGAPERGASK